MKNLNNKKKKMIIVAGAFVLFSFFTFNLASAKFMNKNRDTNEGTFEIFNTEKTLNTNGRRYLCNGIYLKDRRILFPHLQKIFNPIDNTFTDSASFLENYQYSAGDGFVLEDGKVLFVGPVLEPLAGKFKQDIFLILKSDMLNQERKQYSKNSSLSFEEYEKELNEKVIKYLYGLTPKERMELAEPKLKNYPDIEKKYNEYKEKYEKSMYAQLYDPKTNTFSYTGKVNIRNLSSEKIQLSNSKVLISFIGYNNRPAEIEFYNTETGQFELLKTNKILEYPTLYNLKDDKILIKYCKENRCDYYTYYDAKNNKFSEAKNFNFRIISSLQLKNDNILFITGCIKQEGYINRAISNGVVVFNPYTEEIKYVGNFAVMRGEGADYGYVELQDGRILIYGGKEYPSRKKIKSAEILDLKTGKSKIIGNMNCDHITMESILLDDGRVLIYGITPEFYVPNNKNN